MLYAVAVGRGGQRICDTHEEFEASLSGFSNAAGKSFDCPKKAQEWLSQFNRNKNQREEVIQLGDHAPVEVEETSTPEDTHNSDCQKKAFTIGAADGAVVPNVRAVSIALPQSPCTSHGLKIHSLYERTNGIEPLGVLTSAVDSFESSEPRWRVKFGPDVSLVTTSVQTVMPPTRDLIAHYGKDLSIEQRAVLEIVEGGDNIFFTGAAGTGKSVTLRAIIKMMRFKYKTCPQALAVTASTGIAALNIGGGTLHSFAGVGLGKKKLDDLLAMVGDRARERWNGISTLIIDEISMVEGTFFDKLEALARNLRQRDHDNEPFGGIQLVVSGDFFQLPPVPDQYRETPVPATFAFDAVSWPYCIRRQVRLTQVFRQTDTMFVGLLNRMRIGKVDPDMVHTVQQLERDIECNGIGPVKIYPLKSQVSKANSRQLNALSGYLFSNEAKDCGRWLEGEKEAAHEIRISKLLDKHSISPPVITLKEGAQVMLIKNLAQGQFVNGSLGRVVGFANCGDARHEGILNATEVLKQSLEAQAQSDHSDHVSLCELKRLRKFPADLPDVAWPLVEFTNGRRVLLTPLPFDMEDAFGHLEATRIQVPLILAWAITVHKSQGQTIERLKIDFEGTFENGQAYVAMSRSTGLSGLQVLNFKPTMVRAHPRVKTWHEKLLLEEEMDNLEAIRSYFSHNG